MSEELTDKDHCHDALARAVDQLQGAAEDGFNPHRVVVLIELEDLDEGPNGLSRYTYTASHSEAPHAFQGLLDYFAQNWREMSDVPEDDDD